MTETLRDRLIRCNWADSFNADTLVRLIEDHCARTSQGKLFTYKVKEVLRIIDGDTLIINIDIGFNLTLSQTIRIKDIDAPELRTIDPLEKAQGIASRTFVENWLKEKSLIVQTYKDDKYGRMLGNFICNDTGKSLAEAMIAANHAKIYNSKGKAL